MRAGALYGVLGLVAVVAIVALWSQDSAQPAATRSRRPQPAESDSQGARATPAFTESSARAPGASEPTADVAPAQLEAGADAAALRPAGALERQGAGLAFVAGVVRDEGGTPLAGHTIEIHEVTVVPHAGTLQASVVSAKDGSFRIEGLHPGEKLFVLLGPGAGDSLLGAAHGSDCEPLVTREEAELNVTLPAEGLARMAVVGPGHRAVLLTIRFVDDLGRPIDECFSVEGLEDDEYLFTDELGVSCDTVTVLEDCRVRVTVDRDRPWSSEEPADRIYLPLEIQLYAGVRYQDLGTHVLARTAGIDVTLSDATSGQGIGDARVRLTCGATGPSPTEVRLHGSEDGTYRLWTGLTEGDFELSVEAPGYKPGHQLGVLVVGDEPQPLHLVLERER